MQSNDVPYITILTPASQGGTRVTLDRDVVVGRADTCDLRFDDPYLSRLHAAFESRGGTVRVRDLGSSGGTYVNGARVAAGQELRDGDVVSMAGVQVRLTSPYQAHTRVMPTVPPDRSGAPAPAAESEWSGSQAAGVASARYDIGDQRAGTINNVGRDQYNAYVHQRESFLREIAATKTRARWLMWSGFVVFAVGFGVQVFGSMGFMQEITSAFPGQGQPQGTEPPVPSMGGFQVAFVGAAVASIGVVLFVVGLVLHIVAASRRKRVDRELPTIVFAPPSQ